MAKKEAEADRTIIAYFLKGQPDDWMSPVGELKGSERAERLSVFFITGNRRERICCR